MARRFYIIAGEASGDLHGSNLMKGIYALEPDADIRFWGGEKMASVGGTLVQDYRDGAVMGISDVLGSAGKLRRNLLRCKADIRDWKPDVVILIDYPGFNFRIAEFAHKAGFRVFYYIAPKVWASREGRIRKLKKYVDRLFIVFPFEIPYFEEKGIDFIYRGNPLVDAVDEALANPSSREGFLGGCGLPDKPYIAFLAGSRKGEISRMMPVLAEVAEEMKKLERYRDWQFIIAGAPSRSMADYEPWLKDSSDMHVVFGRTQDVVRHAEAAVVNSGTASLETVLLGTPQVVCWSSSALTVFVGRKILRVFDHVKYISLGNLCVDRLVFNELIQEDFTAGKVIAELRSLVENGELRAAMLEGYEEIRRTLGGKGASLAVAKAMLECLDGNKD